MEERNEPLLKAINKLLEKNEHWRVTKVLNNVHPADAAEILEVLPDEEQKKLFEIWDADHSADALLEMSEEEQVDIAETLRLAVISEILSEMPADDAVDLLGDLPIERANKILQKMKPEVSEEVKRLLLHREDTAGGLMTPEFVGIQKEMTSQEAIEYLRELGPPDREIYYIFVIDENKRLCGVLSLRALITAEPNSQIKNIMDEKVIYSPANLDQEEVARIMRKYDLLALPVVADNMEMLGIVTVDDVMDVIQNEATEDMYKMIGLSAEEKVSNPIRISLKRRLPWLYVNLATAILSASVVAFFESTISKLAIIAAFMPVVANQGGVGGSQVATILVRGLALGELDRKMAKRALIKEVSLGLLNGIAIGLVFAIITYLWRGNSWLGLIAGLAMFFNLIAAGFVGMAVPLTLRKIGVDPAIASSIFVTMVTDACAFLFVLGLATMFISWLV